MLAFVSLLAPTAYHRLASPIHDKRRFKIFANRFLVMALVPVSASVILASFLVTSVAIGRSYGLPARAS